MQIADWAYFKDDFLIAKMCIRDRSQGGNYGIFFIVNDELTANEVAMTSIWNINFSGNADEQSDELSQRLSALRQENSEILGSYQLYTRTVIMMSDTSFGMIFTFIGLYLGIVFAMASTVILALQQLSDASDKMCIRDRCISFISNLLIPLV